MHGHAVFVAVFARYPRALDGAVAQKAFHEGQIAVDFFDLSLVRFGGGGSGGCRCGRRPNGSGRGCGGSGRRILSGGNQHADGRGAVGVEGIGVRDLQKFVSVEGADGDFRPVPHQGEKQTEGENERRRRRAECDDRVLSAIGCGPFSAVGVREDGLPFFDAEFPPDILFYRLVVGQNFRRAFGQQFFYLFHILPSFSRCRFSFFKASLFFQVTVPMGMPSISATSRRL